MIYCTIFNSFLVAPHHELTQSNEATGLPPSALDSAQSGTVIFLHAS